MNNTTLAAWLDLQKTVNRFKSLDTTLASSRTGDRRVFTLRQGSIGRVKVFHIDGVEWNPQTLENITAAKAWFLELHRESTPTTPTAADFED